MYMCMYNAYFAGFKSIYYCLHVQCVDAWPFVSTLYTHTLAVTSIVIHSFTCACFQHLGAADTELHEKRVFAPEKFSKDGHVQLLEFLLFLCREVVSRSSLLPLSSNPLFYPLFTLSTPSSHFFHISLSPLLYSSVKCPPTVPHSSVVV